MVGTDFYYDGYKLSDFGMIMTKPDGEQSFISRSLISNEQTPVKESLYIIGVNYDDTLQLDFCIIKDPCLYSDNGKLSQMELNEIRKWLESPKTSKELKVENIFQYEEETICYFGIFTDVQPFIVGTSCYGLNLTFKCNAPHGFSVPMTQILQYPNNKFEKEWQYVCSNGDKYDYVYPTIKVYINQSAGSNSTLSITNKSDNEQSLTIKLPDKEYITIDCKNKQILSHSNRIIPLYDLGFTNENIYENLYSGSTSIYWPRLVDGVNDYIFNVSKLNSVTKIEFTARFVRMVDGF
jgi:phage-related protein